MFESLNQWIIESLNLIRVLESDVYILIAIYVTLALGVYLETKPMTKEESKESEILDFADFINTGLVCQMPDGSLKRILYNSSPEILESRASIPAESFESFNSDLSILLASIATKE